MRKIPPLKKKQQNKVKTQTPKRYKFTPQNKDTQQLDKSMKNISN